jgi:glutaredoxin
MYKVYWKPDCPYCIKAKSLLVDMGQKFEEVEVGREITSDDYHKLVPGFTTVPGIWHDNMFIGGYQELLNFFGEKYLVD